MLKENADEYVQLGSRITDARLIYEFGENFTSESVNGERILSEKGIAELKAEFSRLFKLAKRLNLPVSMKMLGRRMVYDDQIPKTVDAFDMLMEIFSDELQSQLFLAVPPRQAAYYEHDNLLPEAARLAFPMATAEMRMAGNAFALDLYTDSVFHCMRALEYALRALATDVGLTFDAQQWQNIIDQIEGKVNDMRTHGISGMAKIDKDARLQFLSASAKEFAYFKDGWRNYVAHTKATYGRQQALNVLNHVRDFIKRLSDHLKE